MNEKMPRTFIFTSAAFMYHRIVAENDVWN